MALDDTAPTRQLLAHFDMAHREKFGVPAYPLGGKQAKQVAELWKVYGTARSLELMSLFFEGCAFADDCGYSVSVFTSQVPRLLMRMARKQIDSDAWREECAEMHGGNCATAYVHSMRRSA